MATGNGPLNSDRHSSIPSSGWRLFGMDGGEGVKDLTIQKFVFPSTGVQLLVLPLNAMAHNIISIRTSPVSQTGK